MAEIEQDIVSRVILSDQERIAIQDHEAQGGLNLRTLADLGRDAGARLCDEEDYAQRGEGFVRPTPGCELKVVIIGERVVRFICKKDTCNSQKAPNKAAKTTANSIQTIAEAARRQEERSTQQGHQDGVDIY